MEVLELGPKHTTESHESDISSITDTKDGLTIIIDTIDEHGRQKNLKVHFSYVRGFRYLDEGDLIYYWESEKFRSPFHVYEIISGGWCNGEVIQPGILSVSEAIKLREWFVTTTNGCVNVISNSPPTVQFVNT